MKNLFLIIVILTISVNCFGQMLRSRNTSSSSNKSSTTSSSSSSSRTSSTPRPSSSTVNSGSSTRVIEKVDTKATGVLGRTSYRVENVKPNPTSTPRSVGTPFPTPNRTREIKRPTIYTSSSYNFPKPTKVEPPTTVIIKNKTVYVNNHSDGAGYYSHYVSTPEYHNRMNTILINRNDTIFYNGVDSIPESDYDYSPYYNTVSYGRILNWYTKEEYPDLFFDVDINGRKVSFATTVENIILAVPQLRDKHSYIKIYSVRGSQEVFNAVGLQKIY